MRQLTLAGSMFDLRNVVAALRSSGQMERLLSASRSLRAPAYSAPAALPGAGFLALPAPARGPSSDARATDPRRRARKPGQAVAAAVAGAQGSPGGGVGGTLQAQVRGNEPEGRVVRHCFLRSCCIVCHGRYPPGAAWEGWADCERQRPSPPCFHASPNHLCCATSFPSCGRCPASPSLNMPPCSPSLATRRAALGPALWLIQPLRARLRWRGVCWASTAACTTSRS